MIETPVFINCRDRLEPLQQLIGWLEDMGMQRIHLVDNDSTFEPLLEFLERSEHDVIRLDSNLGPLALFDDDRFTETLASQKFIYTDCDILPMGVPSDALDLFDSLLERYPVVDKVGFGLRIDDLPDDYPLAELVREWEGRFWLDEIEPNVFFAPVATTFALYRPGRNYLEIDKPALRTGGAYVARHHTWYTAEADLGDDERHYRNRASAAHGTIWSSDTGPERLRGLLRHPPSDGLGAQHFLASGWFGEGPTVDETEFTPWAESGWNSWNDMSPEAEIADFFADAARVLRPDHILESGVGQGFTTRRILQHLGPEQQFRAFESDPLWRTMLSGRPEFHIENAEVAVYASPSDDDFRWCDLAILDSDVSVRFAEIERWWKVARPNSMVFVHDAGNGHSAETVHARVANTIESLQIPGRFLRNPRGAFIGWKGQPPGAEAALAKEVHDLTERAERAEELIDAIRSSRSYRASEPLRALERWRRSRKGM